MRLRPWQLSLLALALCGVALLGTHQVHIRKTTGREWIFKRLPTDHAIIAGIDVEALRQSALLDLLEGTRATNELNYRELMAVMNFDYRTDLDYVAASIQPAPGERHFILQGRLDWDRWFSAAQRLGGRCVNTFCDLPNVSSLGGTPSYLPLSSDTLGLSVSQTPRSAWALSSDNTDVPLPSIPAYPIFLAMDASLLATTDAVPSSVRPFAQILSTADYVVIGVEQNSRGTFELAVDADCLSEGRAADIQRQLRETAIQASELHDWFLSGTVHTKGRSVHGRWPLARPALEAIAER